MARHDKSPGTVTDTNPVEIRLNQLVKDIEKIQNDPKHKETYEKLRTAYQEQQALKEKVIVFLDGIDDLQSKLEKAKKDDEKEALKDEIAVMVEQAKQEAGVVIDLKTGILSKRKGAPVLNDDQKKARKERNAWIKKKITENPEISAKLLWEDMPVFGHQQTGSFASFSTKISVLKKKMRGDAPEASSAATGGRSMTVMEARTLASQLGGIDQAKAALKVLQGVDIKSAAVALDRWKVILDELDGDEKKATLIYSMISAK